MLNGTKFFAGVQCAPWWAKKDQNTHVLVTKVAQGFSATKDTSWHIGCLRAYLAEGLHERKMQSREHKGLALSHVGSLGH